MDRELKATFKTVEKRKQCQLIKTNSYNLKFFKIVYVKISLTDAARQYKQV